MTHQAKNGDPEKQALRDARAARMRAARAFAGIDQAALAEHLDVAVITIKRMERGSREITLDDCRAIADRCGVPYAFMEDGFPTGGNGDEVRREDLRQLQEAFEARLDQLARALLSREEAQQMSRDAMRSLVRGEHPVVVAGEDE
jgi:transcriptional regulator with XRE-family HTH domain